MPVTQVFTARLPGGGTAVMDTRTGRGHWKHLNPTAAHLWRRLTDGVPLNEAADQVTEHHACRGADRSIVRTDLARLSGQLRAAGLLGARPAPPPDPTLTRIRPALPAHTRLTTADQAAGIAGMSAALVLLRCTPIRTTIAAARLLAHLPLRPATAEQADMLFAAARRAGNAWPGRAACLEESLACYLAAVVRGCRLAWVIGARAAPAGAHAWNEADEQVIGQDLADRVWPYAPALRI